MMISSSSSIAAVKRCAAKCVCASSKRASKSRLLEAIALASASAERAVAAFSQAASQ